MSKADIYARLDALPPAAWDAPIYRQASRAYGPGQVLNGEGAREAGGRWNPPGSFRTVYASVDTETVAAEFLFSIGPGRDPIALSARRFMWQARARVDNLVDLLTKGHQRALGLPVPFDETAPRVLCQQLGAAAYYVRYKGILAPSAARPGAVNVVLFPDYLETDNILELSTDSWPRPLQDFLPAST
jgi:RES domain-containing protein